MNPLKQWRYWLLVVLLVGPIIGYMGLGMLWLWEHGWVTLAVATTIWVLAGILFAILAARWTRSQHPVLPPLDWESPQTFSPLDPRAGRSFRICPTRVRSSRTTPYWVWTPT